MPSARGLYKQAKRKREAAERAQQQQAAQEKKAQEAREKAKQRRLASQQAAAQKAAAEAHKLKVQRGQQVLQRFDVKGEMRGLAKAVKGKVIQDKGETCVTLKFGRDREAFKYYDGYEVVEERHAVVEAKVIFDSDHQPVAISVNGDRVTTKEGLQEALARNALDPFYESKVVKGEWRQGPGSKGGWGGWPP